MREKNPNYRIKMKWEPNERTNERKEIFFLFIRFGWQTRND